MSMATFEPDRERGDENAYEAYRARLGDLCERCHINASLPDDDWCGDCVLEVEAALADVEQEPAA